jgi:hypothetical protein
MNADDIKGLLREAIAIIEDEREIAVQSFSDVRGKIPNAEDRRIVRRYERWLKKAREAIA